jgi:hypothetical protein
MTHCPQRELTGYLRFNLSHCVQSLILQFELSQVLLAHHRAAQSDRNLISAEESYLGIDSPPSAHLRLRPCALRRCINDKDTPKFRARNLFFILNAGLSRTPTYFQASRSNALHGATRILSRRCTRASAGTASISIRLFPIPHTPS